MCKNKFAYLAYHVFFKAVTGAFNYDIYGQETYKVTNPNCSLSTLRSLTEIVWRSLEINELKTSHAAEKVRLLFSEI